MDHNERRAAFSAFIWTIVIMSIVGGIVLWQGNLVHTVPANESATVSVTAYQNALDIANSRLSDAGNRITALEQELAQAKQQPSDTNTAPSTASNDIDAETAIRIATQVAGRLQPVADPELVDLDGQTVWSIVYTPGTVYVSQADGQIVLVERNNQSRGQNRDDNDSDGH